MSASSESYYDVIIIGSGMAGLYAALKVRKLAPTLSFLVVEKYETYGGKSYNEDFENTSVVTGAGIGRLHKDKLLLSLMRKFKIPIKTFETGHNFVASLEPLCHGMVKTTFMELKHAYNKMHARGHEHPHTTFKKFATGILGKNKYDDFVICAGYSDYENEDAYDVLYHYGFDDNYNRWIGFSVPWKKLVDKIVDSLKSGHHIINNTEVTRILKHDNFFEITTKHPHTHPHPSVHQAQSKKKYYCEKVVIATDIDGIKDLIHNISSTPELYYQIKGQPFLRLYAKFSRISIPYLKEKIQGVTIIPGPMQKVIPMDPDHGVYMIIYSDNADADFFKKYFKNNEKNRSMLNTLLENSLDLKGKLRIENIKDFYWKNGTHYYTPLTSQFDTRQDFIAKAQHPDPDILIVGEVISLHQGWVEGALESVEKTLTKKWLTSD